MRRPVILALVLALLAALALSAAACSAPTTIYFYNWGEYIAENTIADFEKAHPDIKVSMKTFDSNEALYQTLQSTSFDVIVPSDYMVARLIKEGKLTKPDMAAIPNNAKYNDPRLKTVAFDPDPAISAQMFDYAVPYLYCTVGLIYNTADVSAPASDAPADVWAPLFDPKFKDRIGMYDSMRESIGVALNVLGLSLNTVDPAQLAKAKDLLIAQKDDVRPIYGIDELKDKYVSGELAAGVAWAGDYVMCLDKLEEAGKDAGQLGFALPKGTNFFVDFLAIPKNAKHPEEAQIFIDYLCRPEVSLADSEYAGYSTPNLEAQKSLPEEIRSNPALYPDDATIASLEVYYSSDEIDEKYSAIWESVMAH
jgi:spermidine/putrescine transport system substrate-binding protein